MVQVMGFVLVLLSVLVNPFSLKAQTIDEVIDHIQDFYQKIQTIQADFIQETYFPQGPKEISSGKLWIKKSGKFRWEYHNPQKLFIISAGNTIYFYYPEAKQALAYPSGTTLGSKLALGFMTGRGNIKTDLKVESFQTLADNFWKINFLTVVNDPKVKRISLVVNPESGEVKEFSFVNASGEVIRVILENLKYNQALKDSLFHFSPSKEVKIINAQAQ